jgi:uracil-DNA glycosylase
MTTSNRQLAYLDLMGVQVWQERSRQEQVIAEEVSDDVTANTLQELYEIASNCQRCEASAVRNQLVFSDGPMHADWLIVGDFPTQQDDREGRPLTGDVAHLLSEMLLAVGVKKSTVHLTNSVKCRSANVEAEKVELLSCRAYLIRQIELVKPQLVFVLGEKAAQSLLKSNESLSHLTGTVHKVDDVPTPIVVSCHPRDLLKTPLAKRQAWDDIQLARTLVNKA